MLNTKINKKFFLSIIFFSYFLRLRAQKKAFVSISRIRNSFLPKSNFTPIFFLVFQERT
ncbi:hypothetical protein LEP1GSC188_4486 [Leptospira weilii serovar Topaz str. LT2116]|uniref:Uncharacterized protein n=1 Tax=Leptospira weilii serovar Topaz str. LT2116 TaxID=1088540 RepID=M3H297_9LEPT|nr:hypothetical protein LEP1GSC188_4486 [Leptospira weilii serovar Topaz str. LT2116]